MTGHPSTPAAEIAITEGLVGDLLRRQHPDLARLPLSSLAAGWDNAVFRLGEHLAVRLPRRRAAAELIRHEQRCMPLLCDRLPIPIPVAVRIGEPDATYPWPWSVVPWFDGETADRSEPDLGEAVTLARFFAALHVPAPGDVPRNPSRGVPLSERAAIVEGRMASLESRGVPLGPELRAIWEAGLHAPIDVEATWIHGDPHPRNLLVLDGRFAAVIDWGDVAQGDRASDLAAFWMLFDHDARRRAIDALPAVTEPTWRRARAWAVSYAVLFLATGLEDDPDMAAIGRQTMKNLSSDR